MKKASRKKSKEWEESIEDMDDSMPFMQS